MTTNLRWNILLGVCALGLAAWYYSLNQTDENLQTLIKKADSPEYVGFKMQTTIFSPEGKKQYFAQADKVEYYTQVGHTDFSAPVVYLFDVPLDTQFNAKGDTNASGNKENTDNLANDGKNGQNWKLSAVQARLTKNNMLYLEGDVLAQSLDPLSRLQRITTSSALVNLKNQDISSDSQVTINGLNFYSNGLKMVGNLRNQTATLKEQVKTYYEINNK